MNAQESKPAVPPSLKVKLVVYGVAFLMVLVPFLFWKGTWFGTILSDEKMKEYLEGTARPRDTQHALLQISEKMIRGERQAAERWYPSILTLAAHPVPEVRNTVAWVMGQDNQRGEFHQLLKVLLKDENPLVRRNAALSLVRFADSSGRPELLNMLQPFAVCSPREGLVKYRLKEDDSVDTGTLMARIDAGAGEPFEVRSLLPGFVHRKQVTDGTHVKAGEEILILAPSDEQVWEALRALYLVGQSEDVGLIESILGKMAHIGKRTREQAQLTLEAIRKRSSNV